MASRYWQPPPIAKASTCAIHGFSRLVPFASSGAGPGQFAMPHAVCVDSHGDVYVAEINGRRLQKFTAK